MPKLTDLSKANVPATNRRLTTPDALYGAWLRKEVPAEVAKQLIDYAAEYDLELAADATDLYPAAKEDGSWFIMVKWSGIERICRSTGLWLPGRTEITTEGGLFATASCYVRMNAQSMQWVEVSAVARYASYCDRDMELDDLAKPKAMGDWAITPEIKLEEVAQYLAAVKALGEYVGKHNFLYSVPRITIHAELLKKRPPKAAAKAVPGQLGPAR